MLAAALVAVGVLALGAVSASAQVIYDNIPTPKPGNLASLGFAATQTSEFGGEVAFAGTDRAEPTVSVGFSSWACETGGGASCKTAPHGTFSWPITLNVYAAGAGDSVGSLIASDTQTVAVPYRPSARKGCPLEEGVQGWGKECFAGKYFKVSFDLAGVTLPEKAIVAVAYNTENYGAAPTHVEGPYNSLNVAIVANYKYNETTKEWETEPNSPSVGSDPLPEQVFLDSEYSALYCGNSAGSFGATGACWKYELPAIQVRAKK
jgi:hypothetical protein